MPGIGQQHQGKYIGHLDVHVVTWTLADADADPGPVVCLRVLPGPCPHRAHNLPTVTDN